MFLLSAGEVVFLLYAGEEASSSWSQSLPRADLLSVWFGSAGLGVTYQIL
jgi:hypothetical protein